MVSALLENNSKRRKRQKKLDIRVILGNPPYSKGQDEANDNNANLSYPTLDGRIRDTYAARTDAQNKNGLYNSYLRAIRWASDRIGESGVVAFVTNAGWIDGNTGSGVRKCLADEFSNLYVFHLRGNAYSSGARRQQEGGNVFKQGSRAPVAVSVLVKNPGASHIGRISYHDIGDYLSVEEKLRIVEKFGSIDGITERDGWSAITPDGHGDWLKQRDAGFADFIPMGRSETGTLALFSTYSRGIETGRDAWVFAASRAKLISNVEETVTFFNSEVTRGATAASANRDGTKIKWTGSLLKRLEHQSTINADGAQTVVCSYRPYFKQWLGFNSALIHRMGKIPKIFPSGAPMNHVICVSAPGNGTGRES